MLLTPILSCEFLGYNELLIIPAGATTVTVSANDGSTSHLG